MTNASADPKNDITLEVLRYLSDKDVHADDIRTTIRVLNAVATLHPKQTKNGLELYKDTGLRPLRKALASCLDLHKQTMYGGGNEDWYVEKRSRKQRKIDERALQKQCIDKTGLRQGRLKRLAALQQQQPDQAHAQLLIADGPVETRHVFLDDGGGKGSGTTQNILPKAVTCYCCKVWFRQLHHFYDRLCPPCADLNWAKRHALAPACRGKVAIVTGSRVKIGYQIVLKLLRSGATVVATSRFPNSTVEAYRKEKDFPEFHSRLFAYGLDLRDVTGIEAFTHFMKQQFPGGIDILIHNACQTIRRPVAYYSPLVEQEQEIWRRRRGDDTHRRILSGCIQFERARCTLNRNNHRSLPAAAPSLAPPVLQLTSGQNSGMGQSPAVSNVELVEETTTIVPLQQPSTTTNWISSYRDVLSDFDTTGVSHSAAMSQIALLPEDVGVLEDSSAPGAFDINGQQLDLRSVNSWVLKLDQVSTPEVLECFFVNAIAPFVLSSKLTPLLCAGDATATRPDRFIVNVSAVEGKFYGRYKSPNHPHTNMAKSALNMLTRTSAEDLAARHRVYMNSVDTGWINDENPLERAAEYARTHHFQTPLDEIDAAARVLDPIFSSLNGEVETPVWGKFLKDYKVTEW